MIQCKYLAHHKISSVPNTQRFVFTKSILNLRFCTLADIPAHIDDKDAVGHVNLALMHIVKHLFRPFCPNLLVPAMPEKADADNDIARERQVLLRHQEQPRKDSGFLS